MVVGGEREGMEVVGEVVRVVGRCGSLVVKVVKVLVVIVEGVWVVVKVMRRVGDCCWR